MLRGTVGSEVVKQLSSDASSYNIKAGVHSTENANKVQQYDRVKAVQIDYDKMEGLESAFKDVDKLFLLTHHSSKTVEHESNLVTEAKKSGIKHIVKQSIMRADLGADVEAMRFHRQAEKLIEESGIPYTFLRPNEFMQGFINFQGTTIKSNNAFYIPAEDAKVILQAVTSDNPDFRYVVGKDAIMALEASRSMSDKEFHDSIKKQINL